jgi:hypothetical protein
MLEVVQSKYPTAERSRLEQLAVEKVDQAIEAMISDPRLQKLQDKTLIAACDVLDEKLTDVAKMLLDEEELAITVDGPQRH